MATIQITVTTRVGVSVDTSPKPLLRDDGKTKIGGLLVVGEHLVFAKDIIAGSSAQTVVNPVVTLTYLADQDSLFLSDDRSQLKFVDTDGNRHAVRIDGDAQVGLVIADGFEGEEQAEEEQEPEVAPRRQARQAKPAASAGRSRRAAPEPEPEFDDGDDPEAYDDELYEGADEGDEGDGDDFAEGDDPEGADDEGDGDDFAEGDDPEGDDPEGDDGEPLFDGDELADIAEEPAPRRQAARAPAKPQGRPAQRQPAGKPAQRRPARQQDADDIDLADLFE